MSRLIALLADTRVQPRRTNYMTDPRATAVGSFWGYQLGLGETADTTLITASTPKRTNLVSNPRALSRAWGKAGSTGTEDRPTTGGPLGVGYQRYQPTTASTTSPITLAPTNSGSAAAPVVPGRTYTFSAYGRALGQAANMSIDIAVNWYDSAGANLSNESTYRYTNTGAWVRYAKTLVAPAGAAYALVTMRFSIAAAQFVASGEFGADHFMVEEGSEVRPYFDGSTASGSGVTYAWTGTANASTSTSTYNDGPVMPDGSRIPTYVRRTITASKTDNTSGPWCRTPVGGLVSRRSDFIVPTMYVRFSEPVTVTVSSSVRLGSGLVSSRNDVETLAPGTWTRVGQPVLATTAGDGTQVWASMLRTMILPVGATVDQTAGLSERGSQRRPYFDGTYPGASWMGAANASPSVLSGWSVG